MNLNNEIKPELVEKKYNFYRKSAIARMLLGIGTSSVLSFLINLSYTNYHKLNLIYMIKNQKQYFCLIVGYYTFIENIQGLFNWHQLYTNFWINSTISGYFCFKLYYRYLIKYTSTQWYSALVLSQKLCLMLVCYNIFYESIFEIKKEILTYSKEDILDLTEHLYSNNKYNKDNREQEIKTIMYNYKLNNNFIVLNSKNKRKLLEDYINKLSDLKSINVKTVDMASFIDYYHINKHIKTPKNDNKFNI